jgi:NDP-sugar pyrophosphorylase family protein
MAGGKGTRLRSVVNDRPKPLALVGNKPIIQTIIENAISSGIRKFYVSVNYKADHIESHLKSDLYSGVSIECIHETSFLGTAGGLGYLGEKWSESMVVSNGDVLTNIAIDRVLDYHEASGADATCVVRPYHVQVPFGVVDFGPNGITGIREKPTHKHVVNTGIYVLSPNLRKLIPIGEFLDMPTLLQKCLDKGLKVVPYLMHEYWRDVGRPEEYALANEEYYNIFGNRH